MGNLKSVSGAGSSVTIDGKVYRLQAIGVGAFGDAEEYVVENRGNPIKRVAIHLQDCGDLLDKQQQQALLEHAVSEVAKQSEQPTDEEVAAFLNTYSGKAFFLWMAIRDRHPEVKSVAATRELMAKMKPEDLAELSEKLTRISGLEALSAAAKNSPSPDRGKMEVDPHESRGLASIGT